VSVTSCVIGRSYRSNTSKILSAEQIQLRWDKPLLMSDGTLMAYELRNKTAAADF